jgi:hypothetical protein
VERESHLRRTKPYRLDSEEVERQDSMGRRPEELASGRKFPIRVSAQRAWTRRRKRLRASLGRVLPPISWRELVVGRGGLAWKRFS